jgi:hypothetical protein
MDISQIAVFFWLSLPILFYIFRRYVWLGILWKYRAFTSGRITDAYYYSRANPDGSKSNEIYIAYMYNVNGKDYSDTDAPFFGRFTAGDVIKVCYDPRMPGESMIWRPGKTWEWMILFLIWLSWVLGTSFFVILLGLYSMLGVVWLIKNRAGMLNLGPIGIFSLIIISIFVLFFAFLFTEMGVDVFENCGFTGQIWLWSMWNHQPRCFLP